MKLSFHFSLRLHRAHDADYISSKTGFATEERQTMGHVEIEAEGVKARIELQFGMISEFAVERGGRKISMLHKAPWLGEKMPEDAAPHLGGL
ncbi:MAG: hypothetical protein M3Y43_02675, partial [Pseudomonadota bacterium]|nr:hypothetical protein [Pseudomonadota bacterium]